jgi:acyl-CoA thioester hydrolase|tara:strand:- start:267 stop:758 length:492 start_codon:yes stop_codon:yes gene_type:complete
VTAPAASAPLELSRQRVLADWIDYNGHMNVAYYVLAFDRGVDELMGHVGLTPAYIEREASSTFTLEIHINYLQELHLGDPIRLAWQLLDFDAKRMHYFLRMYHADEDFLAATSEQIMLHVSLTSRRSLPFPETIQNTLAQLLAAHRDLPRPQQAGRVIGIPKH